MTQLLNVFYSVLPSLLNAFWKLIAATVILIVGHVLIKAICKRIKENKYKKPIDPGLLGFLTTVIKASLYILLVYVVAATVGIPTASFVALIGSAGLTIGLALQGSLSNFAGGVLIITTKPFHVGNYIIVSGGPEGTVDEIGLLYTKMHTPDEKLIVVPNGTLANSTIHTVAPKGERRIELQIGISYSADIALAKKTVLDVISKHENLIRPNDTTVFVAETADSAVILEFRCWAPASVFFSEKAAILEEVKLAFDAAGIEIPFGQLDVHIKNDEK